ncbi:unnamed protein product [Mytilus coruscus]|uniref:Uncharacterized protein n=1 Tax=Mytilus coruscus TaxID=42192 RepID=A0A6J8B3X5_MYTCO|nr:unnamed protein product [Mytilus coruscus]
MGFYIVCEELRKKLNLVVDDERVIGVKQFGKFSGLCPIFPRRKEEQLHVNVLNRSSRCSANLEVTATYDINNIIIKYRCNIITEKCNVLRQMLWISACQASSSTGCNNCKIMSYRRDITTICPNSSSLKIVTDNQLLAANDGFDVSQYLIIWHEIKDVFSQDQSSSQRPLPTTEVFTTTFSDSASYTTVEEQSSSTSSLQTTRSLAPTYSEHVSFTSTAGKMLIDDNKPHPISDSQKVIAYAFRSLETKSYKKNQTIQNSENGNDYTGRQNIALPMQGDLTEYNELAMRRDSHQYGDLKSVGTKLHETTYDYIDPNIHKQETDICKNGELTSTNDPGVEFIQEYSVLDPNEKTSNAVKVILNAGRDCDTYAVLDPDESSTLRSGALKNDQLGISVCESTCVHAKDESYAVLDPNITGFDRTENDEKNESSETYTVLDPKITGFNRSDLTDEPGDMTKDHINKNGLIQPFERDGTDYEFAKHLDDDMSSKSSIPNYKDRTNSEGSCGSFQTGNNQRLQDINQRNTEENVYNRTVDDVYDTASHKRIPTSRNDLYDHFSDEKIDDSGRT